MPIDKSEMIQAKSIWLEIYYNSLSGFSLCSPKISIKEIKSTFPINEIRDKASRNKFARLYFNQPTITLPCSKVKILLQCFLIKSSECVANTNMSAASIKSSMRDLAFS